MGLKALGSKWANSSLILRILIFLIIGVILALVWPVAAGEKNIITLLGTWFVAGLKGVAPVLVFFLVISALANAKGQGNMKTIIVLYIISTVVAALVAVLASYAFPTMLQLPSAAGIENTSPQGIGEVLGNLVLNVFTNPINALMNANYIGILAWGVVLGIALRAASDNTKNVFANVSEAVTKVVRWVIQLAPFGIMGLVYEAVSTSGMEIFTTYGRLVAVLVACMLFIALVTNPIIVFLCTKKNPYPLVWRCLKDSGLTAFFTRSSAANIPVNMTLCEKMGLDKDNYSVSIPLGATINMAGAAVTIAVMSMAAAHTLGIAVDFPTALILCVLAAVSACGASGVAGGSLLLIPLACSLFGIGNDIAMEVVAIGFIIGVIQDSCETALNSSSDALLTATAEFRARRKAGIPITNMGKDAEPLIIAEYLAAQKGEAVEAAPEAVEVAEVAEPAAE